ncbi:Smoothelin [Fragariocoptes setiger]|uniref:Smoothelin n=1 Tax=Fragariocoptes setiger TaxID=1670756 RepID=A0ABQ7S803_9ACAR|nr:Smoothelin [Fragariocoptes setiger]
MGSPIKGRPTNAKDALLHWCYMKTKDYDNVRIENFSSSWSNGLAFCALLHKFFPDNINYSELTPDDRRKNFDLAFKVAEEKAKVVPLLETDDMIKMGDNPDWKCVYTYVQSLYRGLKPYDPTQNPK